MTNIICAGTRHSGLQKIAGLVSAAGAQIQGHSASLSSINATLGELGADRDAELCGILADGDHRSEAESALEVGEVGGVWADEGTVLLLHFWSQVGRGNRFLLTYSSPATALAAFIATHGDKVRPREIDVMLDSWQAQAQAALAFFAANRDLCLLVNGRSALLAPRVFITNLNERFGMALSQEAARVRIEQRVPLDLVLDTVCRTYVEQHRPELFDICNEAKALGTPLIAADSEFVNAVALRSVQTLDLQNAQNLVSADRLLEERAATAESAQSDLARRLDEESSARAAATEKLDACSRERLLALDFIEQLEDALERSTANVKRLNGLVRRLGAEVEQLNGVLRAHQEQACELKAAQNARAALDLVSRLRMLHE